MLGMVRKFHACFYKNNHFVNLEFLQCILTHPSVVITQLVRTSFTRSSHLIKVLSFYVGETVPSLKINQPARPEEQYIYIYIIMYMQLPRLESTLTASIGPGGLQDQ